jgi:preprotein translocase subunit SecE
MKVQEMIAWFVLIVATVASFCGTYLLTVSDYWYFIIWSCWILVSCGCVAMTQQGKQLLSFAKMSKLEIDKVVWPTRQETIQTTLIVVVMVAVTGFVLWGVDSGMMWIIGKITHLG